MRITYNVYVFLYLMLNNHYSLNIINFPSFHDEKEQFTNQYQTKTIRKKYVILKFLLENQIKGENITKVWSTKFVDLSIPYVLLPISLSLQLGQYEYPASIQNTSLA